MRTARTHGGKTKTAWAKLGYVVKDGETGETCYTNQYCQHTAIYYSGDQVSPGTQEELALVFKPVRDKRNKAARLRRAYKSGLKRIRKAVLETKKNYTEKPFQKVVFDIETTGLDRYKDEILQISAINEKGEVLINAYIKPYRKETWEEAERIHNISPEMVKDCKTLDYYAADIQKIFLSATEFITYNGLFDAGFLVWAGFDIPIRTHHDVMRTFAPIYGEWNSWHDSYKWQKLATCAKYYGYKFKAHDSLEDVRATLYCYQKMTETDNRNTDGEKVSENSKTSIIE